MDKGQLPLSVLPLVAGIPPLTLGLAKLAFRSATGGDLSVDTLYLLGIGTGLMILGCVGIPGRRARTFLYFTLFAVTLASLIASGSLVSFVLTKSTPGPVVREVFAAAMGFVASGLLAVWLRRARRWTDAEPTPTRKVI